MQELIEAEVTARIGAGRYERSSERTTRRNGSRPKQLAIPTGTLELTIPRTPPPGRLTCPSPPEPTPHTWA